MFAVSKANYVSGCDGNNSRFHATAHFELIDFSKADFCFSNETSDRQRRCFGAMSRPGVSGIILRRHFLLMCQRAGTFIETLINAAAVDNCLSTPKTISGDLLKNASTTRLFSSFSRAEIEHVKRERSSVNGEQKQQTKHCLERISTKHSRLDTEGFSLFLLEIRGCEENIANAL